MSIWCRKIKSILLFQKHSSTLKGTWYPIGLTELLMTVEYFFIWERISTFMHREIQIEGFTDWSNFYLIKSKEEKLLLCCSCNSNKNLLSNPLKEIGNNIDKRSSNYENVNLLGDLNSEAAEPAIEYFCLIYSYKYIILNETPKKNFKIL